MERIYTLLNNLNITKPLEQLTDPKTSLLHQTLASHSAYSFCKDNNCKHEAFIQQD